MNIRIAAVALLVPAVIALTACGTTTTPTTGTAPSVSASFSPYTVTPAPAQTTQSAPKFTPAQLQAFETALGYLTDGQGFSKAGLISQLHSPYGNGYSLRLARWAVDKISNPRVWMRQAVISARGYMNDGQGFSAQGLVDQLDSPYGGQFTYAQALYAANKVGL